VPILTIDALRKAVRDAGIAVVVRHDRGRTVSAKNSARRSTCTRHWPAWMTMDLLACRRERFQEASTRWPRI